ncbi:hypothetical protein FQN54_005939 [Arachnomyces sp. PD_36]|nr:hypothetical protein FQN54_005939 [Arachnomyces sp. PD_36]
MGSTSSNPTTTFVELAKNRRTHYALSPTSPVPDSEIEQLVKDAALHVPSSFNTQSTRLVLLLHDQHKKLWDLTIGVFEGLVEAGKIPKEMWEGHTQPKLQGMRNGYGTVLFFEDPAHIAPFSEKFPTYKEQFPKWAQHSNAMHQYFLWTTLESLGFGANLQHFNPLIDEAVAKEWSLPSEWGLVAQLVFGTPTGEPGEKSFNDLETRVKIFK